MGNFGSKSKIIIRYDKPGFNAGTEVTGEIFVCLDESMNIDSFSYRLKGKEKTVVTSTHTDKDGKRHTTYHRAQNEIFVNQLTTPGQRIEGRQTYKIPFRLSLSKDLPPTLKYNTSANVFYILKVKAHSQGREIAVGKEPFTVYPYIPPIVPLSISQRIQLTRCCCIDKKTVVISFSLGKSFYLPGEPINVNVSIWNESEEDISAVRVALQHSMYVTAIGHSDSSSHFKGETIMPSIPIGEKIENYSCVIVPKHPCDVPSASTPLIKSTYSVQIYLDRNCAINERVSIPIMIGPAQPDANAYFARYDTYQSYTQNVMTLPQVQFAPPVNSAYSNYANEMWNGMGSVDTNIQPYDPYKNSSAPIEFPQNASSNPPYQPPSPQPPQQQPYSQPYSPQPPQQQPYSQPYSPQPPQQQPYSPQPPQQQPYSPQSPQQQPYSPQPYSPQSPQQQPQASFSSTAYAQPPNSYPQSQPNQPQQNAYNQNFQAPYEGQQYNQQPQVNPPQSNEW